MSIWDMVSCSFSFMLPQLIKCLGYFEGYSVASEARLSLV